VTTADAAAPLFTCPISPTLRRGMRDDELTRTLVEESGDSEEIVARLPADAPASEVTAAEPGRIAWRPTS